MPDIHPSAVVEAKAILADDVAIGPFCLVGAGVRLDAGVRLHSHAVVVGNTSVGARTEIFPFASIGHAPQDLKYKGEPSRLEIGTDNRIREYVTMNPGTEGGGMLTKVGNGCLFMASAHVAHDCLVGDQVILANNATLAGHVQVGDFVIIGGLSAVQQFVRIGAHAMIGGMSGVASDVIPYGIVFGARASLSGLNLVGLRRRGFPREEIDALRHAYDLLFRPEGTLAARVRQVEAQFGTADTVRNVIAFIEAENAHGILTPKA
jgi:UDP-N-acetylglucosamine acyltransferase